MHEEQRLEHLDCSLAIVAPTEEALLAEVCIGIVNRVGEHEFEVNLIPLKFESSMLFWAWIGLNLTMLLEVVLKRKLCLKSQGRTK